MGNRMQIRERPPELPVEVHLDIFARVDSVTLVRGAAASKLLRRHINDPAFLRLRRHADGDGGFVPSLLVGMFFYHFDEVRRFVPVSPSSKLRVSLTPSDADHVFGAREPVASRGGLVVLRRRRYVPCLSDKSTDLCVYSPVAGWCRLLPPAAVSGDSHVPLPGDNEDDEATAHRSFFRLLVLDEAAARTQTYSSSTGTWGAVTAPPASPGLPNGSWLARPSAVVLHGVAHWLYAHRDQGAPPRSQRYVVLAVHVGGAAGSATAMEIPRRCLLRRRRELEGELLLARSADGRLGLLVAEALGIAMWTLSSSEPEEGSRSWTRRMVVDRDRMLRSVTLRRCDPLWCVDTELEWFGEASSIVVLQVNGAGILLLNLQTGVVTQFRKGEDIRRPLLCCPFEMGCVFRS
ncbi:hypothetical protein ACP70R_027300 [Stipagrostis hirtigluma subsp. patula]